MNHTVTTLERVLSVQKSLGNMFVVYDLGLGHHTTMYHSEHWEYENHMYHYFAGRLFEAARFGDAFECFV